MGAFVTWILVCAINVGIDDCRPNTAIDFIRAESANSQAMCFAIGQVTLAQTSLAPVEGKEYAKIMCPSRLEADEEELRRFRSASLGG